jgi:hypothetical protein
MTICVPPHSCRPINGSTNNLRTLKCMHPIQMMDILQKFYENLGAQLRFQ